MTDLSWPQVLSWRLGRHHLVERAPRAALLDVVAGIAGLHAQVASSAELALWARLADPEPGATQRALWEDRSLVKTWAMRGTLHLLPASEFPLWQAALSTYRHYLKASWFRYFGVDRQELERLLAAVAGVLDGRALTREELAEAVTAETGSAALGDKLRSSWGALLKPASFRGLLCFAPSAGQNVRFARPDQWLGAWTPVDPAAAQAEVTRRYLGAYGPAARQDYGRWWGVSPAAALKLIKGLGDEVCEVEVEGARGWLLRDHLAGLAQAEPPGVVRLLPAFDPWVVGASRDVPQLLSGPVRDRVYRPQGWLSPVLLVDGRMDGVWRHEVRGGTVAVTIEPFTPPPAWERRAAADEAERLAAHLGGTLALSWA